MKHLVILLLNLALYSLSVCDDFTVTTVEADFNETEKATVELTTTSTRRTSVSPITMALCVGGFEVNLENKTVCNKDAKGLQRDADEVLYPMFSRSIHKLMFYFRLIVFFHLNTKIFGVTNASNRTVHTIGVPLIVFTRIVQQNVKLNVHS